MAAAKLHSVNNNNCKIAISELQMIQKMFGLAVCLNCYNGTEKIMTEP